MRLIRLPVYVVFTVALAAVRPVAAQHAEVIRYEAEMFSFEYPADWKIYSERAAEIILTWSEDQETGMAIEVKHDTIFNADEYLRNLHASFRKTEDVSEVKILSIRSGMLGSLKYFEPQVSLILRGTPVVFLIRTYETPGYIYPFSAIVTPDILEEIRPEIVQVMESFRLNE